MDPALTTEPAAGGMEALLGGLNPDQLRAVTHGVASPAESAATIRRWPAIGFIWATVLWEMTWEIMAESATPYRSPYQVARGAGNQVALNLVNFGSIDVQAHVKPSCDG